MENQKLPNSTAALVLGILSVVTCCCYGLLGLPLGIIAVVLGNKALKLDNLNPGEYTGRSNASTGKILGIVGIILNILMIAYIAWVISFLGWEALQDPQLLQERLQEMQ